MPRRRIVPMPKDIDTSRVCAADGLRWYVATHPRFGNLTDARLGKELGLSAGYVGLIMSGKRPPTRAFLKAIGWEALQVYQMKSPRNPVTRGHG